MTFEEIYNLIIADWCNRLGIAVENAGFTIIVTSKVISGGLYLLAKIIDALSNNVWVGSMQASKLIEVGQDKIGRSPYLAVQGEYSCSTIAVGVGNIPAGSIFTKDINNVTYSYESLAEVAGGDTIQVRALTAGTKSKLVVGDELTAVKDPTYASNMITVTVIDEEPLDGETIEDYRKVVVDSFVLRGAGAGNAADYIIWAGDVQGIWTVYPYAADGEAGKVKIYCEGLAPDFVPSSALIDDVIDAIKYDSNGVGRVLVDLYPFITDEYILPVQIAEVVIDLVGGNLTQQSDAEAILEEYLINKRPYLATLNKVRVATKDTITTVEIVQALADGGITFTGITLKVTPPGGSQSTYTTYQVGNPNNPDYYGEIPVLNALNIS
jgi:uncharacterized phage protein gp47/JayE